MPRHAGRHARNTRSARLLALAGVLLAGAVVLPLAVASAGSVGSRTAAQASRAVGHASGALGKAGGAAGSVQPSARGDGKARGPGPGATATRSPLPGTGEAHLSTAVRCGPELSSPEGVEAQTCVVAQGEDTWARTYYRNATGGPLDAVLALLGPGGRSVRMHCAADGEDEPAICETPRERRRADLAEYTAVTEFSDRAVGGPLLLRSGSNSHMGTSG